MPTYVYKFVKSGETIEVQQSFHEDALTQAVHPRSGRRMAVKKVFTPVGVTFRGGGFYKTDSRGKSSSTPPSTSDSKSESKSESKNESKSESKNGDSGSSSNPSSSSESTASTPTPKKSESGTSTSTP